MKPFREIGAGPSSGRPFVYSQSFGCFAVGDGLSNIHILDKTATTTQPAITIGDVSL